MLGKKVHCDVKDLNQLRKTERKVVLRGKPEALTGEYRKKPGERVGQYMGSPRFYCIYLFICQDFITALDNSLMFHLVKYNLSVERGR